MKYLRLFENKFYKQIPNLNFLRIIDSMEFSEYEFNIIKNVLLKKGINDVNQHSNDCGFYIKFVYDSNIPLFIRVKLIENPHYIYKLEDEWYILALGKSYKNRIYRCDQIDGLIKCIQDNV